MGVEPFFIPIAMIYPLSLMICLRVSFRMAKTGRKTALLASILVFLMYCFLPGLYINYEWSFSFFCGLLVIFIVLGSASLLLSQRWRLFKTYTGFAIIPFFVCLIVLADIELPSNGGFVWLFGPPVTLFLIFYFPLLPALSSVASVFFVRAFYEENRLGVFPR